MAPLKRGVVMVPLTRGAQSDHGVTGSLSDHGVKVASLAEPGMSTLEALLQVGKSTPPWWQADCTSPRSPVSTAASTPLHECETVPATVMETSPARFSESVSSRTTRGDGKGIGKRLVSAVTAEMTPTSLCSPHVPAETVQDAGTSQSSIKRPDMSPSPSKQKVEDAPSAQVGKECVEGV